MFVYRVGLIESYQRDVPTYYTSQNGEIPLIIDLIALALNLSRDCVALY